MFVVRFSLLVIFYFNLLYLVLADDSILPKLGPEDTTPPTEAQKESNEWIKKHLDDKPEKGSPYRQRPDGSADLVG